MITLTLPIKSNSWLSTISRWAAELRGKVFYGPEDFSADQWSPTLVFPAGAISSLETVYTEIVVPSDSDIVWIAGLIKFQTTGGPGSEMEMTLPFPVNENGYATIFGFSDQSVGSELVTIGRTLADRATISWKREAATDWSTASYLQFSGWYRRNR